ncbi:MAG: hypothetical protein HDS15_00950 [Bacteroides sp.]|nr:hypothetical protein [Bacteroides sp.]
MATLEKIRSHSVLLLMIIGLALLAFVVGDFFNSGHTLFGTGTTVAKVDGESIDIQQFQQRLEQASQQLQQTGQKVDGAVLQEQVLSQMVSEALMNKEISKLGLTVTTEELTNALMGPGAQYVNMFVQQQYGLESAQQLCDIATNPAKYNLDAATSAQFRQLWKSLEDQMEQSLLQQKFATLFNGAITANDLDAKAIYEENATTSKVTYAKKDYSSLADDEFKPTDAQIESVWASQKELYRLPEEQRAISYIAVSIAPSKQDLAEAESRVGDAKIALLNQPSTDGLAEMTDFVVNRNRIPASALTDKGLRSFADSAKIGSAEIISHIGNEYTLAKLLDRSIETDSVCMDFAMVAGTKAHADSVIAALNAGRMTIAEATGEMQSQDSIWVQLSNPQMAELRSHLIGSSIGTWFTPDTSAVAQGARVFRVRSRKQPVSVVDMAVVSYSAEPSNATINKIESELRDFVRTNNTAALFEENAAKSGYTSVPAYVSVSTPQIGRMEDTRSAIRWALEAKKGQVSPVFGDIQSGQFVAVALNDIYKNYLPATDPQIRQNLVLEAMNNNKAAKLIEEYKGKANDVAGYSQLMDASIDTTNVTFGQPMIVGLGYNDSEVLGNVAVAQKGQTVGPLQGNNSVIVLQVIDVDSEGRPYSYAESAQNYNRTRGAAMLGNALTMILQGNKKVDNRLMKFFRD